MPLQEEIDSIVDDLTIDVITHAVSTKKLIRKIFWLCLFIVGVVLTIYQTTFSVLYLRQYEVITTVSVMQVTLGYCSAFYFSIISAEK